MSDTLERLRQMQRRQLLGQVSVTDRLIKQVYIRAAKHLGKLAEGAKDESLTKRWAEDYLKAVNAEIGRINAEIERAITKGAQSAAEIRTGTVEEYLKAATGAAWAELSDRFTDVLSHCRTDALRAMIDGKLYKDGRELSKRIWSATGRLEGQIEEILLQGVAQKQSTWQIARALEAYVNPKAACPISWKKLYPDTPFEIKVDYNATRLARTAINHVFWQTGINAAKANPFCAAMHWELSNAHYERQVAAWGECECDAYAQHDEGLGRGNFKPENLPRPHPNCLCYQYEVLPTPEDAADRFRAWMDGAEDEALERGFGEWVKEEDRGTSIVHDLASGPGLDSDAEIQHDPPVYIRDLLDDEDRNVILSQYEDEIKDEPVENAVVITADGKIYRCKGTLDQVFVKDLGKALIDADVVHNHPIGSRNEYSFSSDDIGLFFDGQLRTLRGIDERFQYLMTRDVSDVDEEPIDWMNSYNFRHGKVVQMAHLLGFGYRRWERDKGRS